VHNAFQSVNASWSKQADTEDAAYTTMMDASEIAKHNTKDSCWVVIHGTAWDVTGGYLQRLCYVPSLIRSQTSLMNTLVV
jgi:cytochrome b involved in lipid metabolism